MGVYLGRAGQAGGAMEVEQIALCRSKNSDLCVLFGANSLGLGDFPSTGALINMQFVSKLPAQSEGRKESHRDFFFQKTLRIAIPVRLERRADFNSYSTCAVTTQL
jgi:hypothetical protein